MRNRSAIWIFTILLFLACLYQLSFSWVTKSFESNISDLAEKKYDSISNEAVNFVINGDTLIIGSDKEKQQIISFYEQKLLAENANKPTYPLIDLDYQRCKDQELGLGLDLQGGMSVTLEVSIEDLLRNFAGNSSKISFKTPFNAALKDFKEGNTDVDSGTEKLEQIFKVEFKDINFKYPNSDDYVLKNINFKLNAGMSLGIFGKTGAGKSSLVQLLCRLYEPSEGEIFINDISYKKIELNAYRKKIGYVPQDVFLFSDSIENNIAFGLNKEDFNEDEIKTAAESAGLLNEIETFNDSFQTKIGERGVTLSGGQKQRVSIARVLFRKPQLLIFDDCLSAVDSQTSKKIQQSLNKNSSKKISIHISHKINNISNCNHILVLENGEIVDRGNHESLLKSKGFYYDIFKKQQLEDN